MEFQHELFNMHLRILFLRYHANPVFGQSINQYLWEFVLLMATRIGVLRETDASENRVSMVPDLIGKISAMGAEVIVEKGAGSSSHFMDSEYSSAGAQLVGERKEILGSSDVILTIHGLGSDEIKNARKGTILIGMISLQGKDEVSNSMANAGLTVFSLNLMPRISRAQTMDVLSSQSSISGYRAVLLGAFHSPRLFPMLTTAAGTVRPAKVLVIGAGVAGLMAIATARRLGAVVEAYDIRKTAGEDVRSLGARFLETQVDARASGGYARELTPEEKKLQTDIISNAVSGADVIITTASIPGRKAPVIVSRDMIQKMKAGSVIIDLAADTGGNCEITRLGETVIENDVSVLGPNNLPSEVPYQASQLYARNVLSFLPLLISRENGIASSFEDEILKACLLMHNGELISGSKGTEAVKP